MDKVFDFILENLRKLPPGLQVFFIFILLLGYPLYKILMSSGFQKFFLKKIQRRINRLSQKDLLNNDVFLLENFFRLKVDNLVFDNPQKTEIFKIILGTKIETDLQLLQAFIKEKNFSEMSIFSLSKEMSNLVLRMVHNGDTLSLDRLIRKYGRQCGEEIYLFIMNAKNGYRHWRKQGIDRIFMYINEYIEKSSIYDNNIERVDTFLYEVKKSIKDTIFEVEREFKNFNGQIAAIIKKYSNGSE